MNASVDVATVRLTHRIDFTCALCGHRARGLVRVEAEGAATVNATAHDSRLVAEERAAKGANKVLERALLSLRCPACQQFNPQNLEAYRRDRIGAAAVLLVLGAIGAGLAGVVFNLTSAVALGLIAALVSIQPLYQAARPPPVAATFEPEG